MTGTAEIQAETFEPDVVERRLQRLFGCLAFVVEEAERLGLAKTAIEARRAGLQLCYETESEKDLSLAFAGGIEGHG